MRHLKWHNLDEILKMKRKIRYVPDMRIRTVFKLYLFVASGENNSSGKPNVVNL